MAERKSLWLLLSALWIYSSLTLGVDVQTCDLVLSSGYNSCSPLMGACGSSGKCYTNCLNASNSSATCNVNSTQINCEIRDCVAMVISTSNMTTDMAAPDESDRILTLPRMTFIIIVAVAGGVVILCVVFLFCLCCCCCMQRRRKYRLENLKQKLIEQPEVDNKSPSRNSYVSPVKKASILNENPSEAIRMQPNRALTQEFNEAPPSSVTELLPMNKNSFSSSKSMDHIRESTFSDTEMRPKADSDAYLKMNAVGTVRPSLSCHDIVEEEIYVEPDQNPQPCDAVAQAHVQSHSIPPSTDKRSSSKSPHHQQLENPYSNQEAIARHSAGSPENEGYQNVIPPISPRDESYTTVAEFLQGQSVRNIEDEEEENATEEREYYNYIPGGEGGDEMYVYMQTGIASANGNPTSDQDRVRGPLKSNQSVKYINLSKQDQVNLRLPGSEYREPEAAIDAANDNVDGEQPIYANYVEDELYTAMS